MRGNKLKRYFINEKELNTGNLLCIKQERKAKRIHRVESLVIKYLFYLFRIFQIYKEHGPVPCSFQLD